MTEEEKFEQWDAISDFSHAIDSVSKQAENGWPEVVNSWEDMALSITAHLVQKRQATALALLERGARRRVLAKIAQQIASTWRDEYEHFNGNFRYSTDEVRQILSRGAISSSIWDSVDSNGNPLEESAWHAGSGRTAFGKQARIEPFDIRAAFPQLSAGHRRALVRKYAHQEILNGAERMELSRAVESLTRLMNRGYRRAYADHDGPGKPRLTNAQAISKVGEQ